MLWHGDVAQQACKSPATCVGMLVVGVSKPEQCIRLTVGAVVVAALRASLQAGTESAQAPQLYTVLEQRKASALGAGLMGTDHVYVMPGQEGATTVGGVPGKRR